MRMGPSSISDRAFRTVLFGLLSSLLVILVFAWWALEDLEDTLLEADRIIELGHFEKYGEKDRYQKIQTGQMVSVFNPRGHDRDAELPIVFQGLPVPYEGTVDLLGAEYTVVTHAFPEGDFYLAKNLQLFVEREEQLILYVQLLAFGVLVVGVVVARLSSRILSQPIVRLATAIHELRDSGMAGRLDEQFADHELNEIAAAINTNLDQVEESFRRERALISMASHELRTPVSVVLGAAAIIEKRGKLQADDARTLQRINRAAQDMSANIQALLDLVRRTRQEVSEETFRIADLLHAIRADYEMDGELDLSRLVLANADDGALLCADKTLVKMVLHNLISNALGHTRGQVTVTSHADHVEIADEGGAPLPAEAADRPVAAVEPQSAGLGLYIVSLACERLGWLFESDARTGGGRVRLWFSQSISQA